MRFTHIDINFDIRYEGHQNCPKILSMNILRVFSDHHLWRQNWRQYLWTSLCQFNFFVNLLHSLGVWIFDIWHLFDNLTSFWYFGSKSPMGPIAHVSHTPVPHCPSIPLSTWPIPLVPHTPLWTSLCQFNFFVNLLHSLGVWIFDIWHLFDNLTSFWYFGSKLPMGPIAHVSHTPVPHCPSIPLSTWPIPLVPHTPLWTSLCQFNFFVNLLHSLGVWIFDIWHLFDNLTSFWYFGSKLPMGPIAHVSHTPVPHCPSIPLSTWPIPLCEPHCVNLIFLWTSSIV